MVGSTSDREEIAESLRTQAHQESEARARKSGHYSGQCTGGPWDGMSLAHQRRNKILFQYVAGVIGARNIGTYVLNDYDMWVWNPSEDAKAIETLLGGS